MLEVEGVLLNIPQQFIEVAEVEDRVENAMLMVVMLPIMVEVEVEAHTKDNDEMVAKV